MLNGIEADSVKIDGLFHRRLEIGDGERFQQAQHLCIFAPARGHSVDGTPNNDKIEQSANNLGGATIWLRLLNP